MLRVSSTNARRCNADREFRASSITRLDRFGMLGILQERRKRVFDLVIAVPLFIFLLPGLLLIAALIKATSKGPVLFKQTRYGRFKRPFAILKFRTMNVMEDGDAFKQAQRDDPRITPLGAILRRTSLDELPQLWNVIRGEMSLIGPRPHATKMDDDYARRISGYEQRFLMRPGITGLAQCRGHRGGTDTITQMISRLSHDLFYVRNRTMWLDIKILWQTIIALMKNDAY